MIKQLPITLLLLITLGATAQNKRKFLYGFLSDELGVIANAHIINLNTQQGTFSNDLGEFRILAKPNDTLQISFVGYETKKVKVTSLHFGMEENEIKDIGIKKKKKALDFSMIDFSEKVILDIDEVDRSKPPSMIKTTDPTAKFAGVGGGFSSGLDKYSQQLKRTRKTIQFKESFPKMLLSEFGEHFFYKELNIPKDKYLLFLEYCNPLGIEKLYKQKQLLKVIAILQQESKSYLKVISN